MGETPQGQQQQCMILLCSFSLQTIRGLVQILVQLLGLFKLLNVLLAQVVPTALEFLMVLALLQLRVGWTVAATAVVTLSAYWAFTAAVTTRRAQLRREMNRLEGQSSGEMHGAVRLLLFGHVLPVCLIIPLLNCHRLLKTSLFFCLS